MEIQVGRYFLVKLDTALPIHRCIELSNPSRIDRDAIFFKDICNSRGECAPPPTNSKGGYFCPLPNRSGRYQGTTPTTWLNFYTPCKLQFKMPGHSALLLVFIHVSLFSFVVALHSEWETFKARFTCWSLGGGTGRRGTAQRISDGSSGVGVPWPEHSNRPWHGYGQRFALHVR